MLLYSLGTLIDSGRAGGRKSAMETILIMAQALAKAKFLVILRLDIHYDKIDDVMSALCVLGSTSFETTEIEYIIHEDGTVQKREEGII